MTLAVILAAILAPVPAIPQGGDSLRLALTPIHYDLAISIDYESERLEGRAAITVRNWSGGPVTTMPLTLYRLMTIDVVRGPAGERLALEQDVVPFEDFGKLQVLAATVRLARPLAPNDTTTITVHWSGYLLGYAETGMRYVQDHIAPEFTILRNDANAFPQVEYPSWAANRRTPWPSHTYRAAITVPDSLTVANGGRRVDLELADGRATFVYESIKPSFRMDFAIARYGLLTASPLRVFYLPGDSAGAAGVLRAGQSSLDLFTRWFGPLAGDGALTFLEIPDGWGSQTDVTTIIQAAAAFRDSTRHHEVYHEVSHLWNPPERETPSPRWNEGLASFLEMLAVEELQGRPVRDRRADQLIAWLRENGARRPQWGEVPLVRYGEAQLTDLSYSVGAVFFDLLYRVAGAATFRAIVGDYYQRYAVMGGSTELLMALIRERVGPGVEPLLQDWIYTAHWLAQLDESPTIGQLAAHYGAP